MIQSIRTRQLPNIAVPLALLKKAHTLGSWPHFLEPRAPLGGIGHALKAADVEGQLEGGRIGFGACEQ